MQLALIKTYTGSRPTWLGWTLIATLTLSLFWIISSNLYTFLAPAHPPHHGLLVIEGWIDDQALNEAALIYKEGNYPKIITTGIPFETGSYLLPFRSYPEMTTDRLQAIGIAPEAIITTIGIKARKDRTYSAALALKEYLDGHAIPEKNIHLITIGPHGRRSRLLFQKALGKEYSIGITCLPDSSYDPERWYAYSEGVRSVISELIAYSYAKLLFHP